MNAAGPDAPQSAYLIDEHGEVTQQPLADDEQVALWGRALHIGADGVVEVVAARREPDGTLRMRSRAVAARFPAAGDLAALVGLARRHRAAAEEVFCTPLTRRERRSGKAGQILPARCCWVDIDEPDKLALLRAFQPRPHLVVYSGSGGAHGYWRLARPIAPDALEAANRKLAHAVGADEASTDRARIMRLPGSHNYKADAPCRLAYCDLARPGVDAATLVGELDDPDPPAPPPSAAERRRQIRYLAADDALTIAPPSYFWALAGVEVDARGGHIACPLPDHDEQLASCMVYPDAEDGWHCYGCRRGGAIYDLASLLAGGSWGHQLRGDEFKALKAEVQQRLGIEPAAVGEHGQRLQQSS